jgi:hypothetical protein
MGAAARAGWLSLIEAFERASERSAAVWIRCVTRLLW